MQKLEESWGAWKEKIKILLNKLTVSRDVGVNDSAGEDWEGSEEPDRGKYVYKILENT